MKFFESISFLVVGRSLLSPSLFVASTVTNLRGSYIEKKSPFVVHQDVSDNLGWFPDSLVDFHPENFLNSLRTTRRSSMFANWSNLLNPMVLNQYSFASVMSSWLDFCKVGITYFELFCFVLTNLIASFTYRSWLVH